MKFIVSIFCALLFSAVHLFASIPGGWSTNFIGALNNTAQRPVLAFFTASWCGPCKLMTATTLTDPLVFSALDGVEHVGVDIDDQRDLAGQHEIEAVPTFVVFTPSGHEVSRMTGYHDVGEFLEWLTNGIAQAQIADADQKRMDEQLTAAIQLAKSDTNFTAQAVAKLFDLFAGADAPAQKTIAEELSQLAGQNPALLLDGLNHPRLIVRICAANLLRARLGDAFDIDPWSDAATREKAVADWRQRLSAAAVSKNP